MSEGRGDLGRHPRAAREHGGPWGAVSRGPRCAHLGQWFPFLESTRPLWKPERGRGKGWVVPPGPLTSLTGSHGEPGRGKGSRRAASHTLWGIQECHPCPPLPPRWPHSHSDLSTPPPRRSPPPHPHNLPHGSLPGFPQPCTPRPPPPRMLPVGHIHGLAWPLTFCRRTTFPHTGLRTRPFLGQAVACILYED